MKLPEKIIVKLNGVNQKKQGELRDHLFDLLAERKVDFRFFDTARAEVVRIRNREAYFCLGCWLSANDFDFDVY